MEQYEATVNREALKAAMREAGLSNQGLANLAGCSKGTIGGLLTKRNKCSETMAWLIAEALDNYDLFTVRRATKEGK